MTGLRPSTTGVYGLAPWFRTVKELKTLVTLPQHFAKAGYKTYTVGKIYHGRFTAQGAEEFDVVGKPEPGLRPEEKHVTTPRGGRGMDWAVYPYKDLDHTDWKRASWAVEQLNQKPDKPFFMAVGFSLPHVPLFATQKWFDLYPEDEIKLPRMLLDDRSDTPAPVGICIGNCLNPARSFCCSKANSSKSSKLTSPVSASSTVRSAACWRR